MDREAREQIIFCRTCYKNYLAPVRLDEYKVTPLKSLVASNAGWGLFANAPLPEKFFIPYGGEIVLRRVDTYLFTPSIGAELASIADTDARARRLAEMLRSSDVQRRNTSHFRVIDRGRSALDGRCAPGPVQCRPLKHPDSYMRGVAQYANHTDQNCNAQLIGRWKQDTVRDEQGAITLRPVACGEEITVFYCRHYDLHSVDGPEISLSLMNIHPVRRITRRVNQRTRANVRKRTRADQEAERIINKVYQAAQLLPSSLR